MNTDKILDLDLKFQILDFSYRTVGIQLQILKSKLEI